MSKSKQVNGMVRAWVSEHRRVDAMDLERVEIASRTSEFLDCGGRITHYDNMGKIKGWIIRNLETGANEFCPNIQKTNAPSGIK